GVKWNLFQDRKALVTAPINFLGYFVFLYFLLYFLVNRFTAQQMPILIPRGTFLYTLVVISTIFMIWRSINRVFSVTQIYGILPGITSIPRSIWGNTINFFAIIRAILQYGINKLRGKEVRWDKTIHELSASKTREGESAVTTSKENQYWLDRYDFELPPENLRRMFKQRMAEADNAQKIEILENLSREHSESLLPAIVDFFDHPAWEIRAAVCRSLSYLQEEEAIPYLKEAAKDLDWVVRSNAVRALGKLDEKGEKALFDLLHSDDNYARDAARTVLEQQGFLDRYREMLSSGEPKKVHQSLKKLELLAEKGNSKLAEEIIENNLRSVTEKDQE
ncbi:MAG: HEAT repeat domain-containing protein, partial [Brevefilum sp.]